MDAEAALPAGSASNHYRTRDALIRAVIDRTVVLDHLDWKTLAATAPPDGVADPPQGGLADSRQAGVADEPPGGRLPMGVLVAAISDFVRLAVTAGRDRTLARYALCLEAAVRPDLAAELRRANAEIRSWATPWLTYAGSPDPQGHSRLVMDYLEGVLVHQVSFPDPHFDPTPGIDTLLRALLRTP